MTKDQEHGDAYQAVRFIYNKSPGKSWRRLNGALQDALTAAIVGNLSFLPGDFRAICRDMNGGYWMGNSVGATCGEGYYSVCVKHGHTAACISFEQYAGRPAALWSDSVHTPDRMHIGYEFTWKGQRVEVTSIRQDHIVACAYEGARYSGQSDTPAVGQFESLAADRKYRQIEKVSALADGGLTVRFGPPVDDPYMRKPSRVFKITFEELSAVRKAFESARRVALKDIAAASTIEALAAVEAALAEFPAGTFRHFDVEDIRNAALDKKRALEDGIAKALEETRREKYQAQLAESYEADLEAWVGGQPARQWFREVRLRVRGNLVETSTGQYATVDGVRRALPVVLRRKKAFGPVANLMVDSFRVEEQSPDGVKVGCTWVPWPEVHRLAKILEVA